MTQTATVLSHAQVQELSRRLGEPDWARERRLAGFRAYGALGLPRPDEESWRRTSLKGLDLDSFPAYTPAPRTYETYTALPAELRALFEETGEEAGRLVQRNGDLVFSDEPAEVAAKGVIFCSLAQALRDHPELVQPHLGAIVTPGENKFTAMNAALWSAGAFLYVPKDVDLELPLHALVWQDRGGVAVFPRTLIVVDRNARATLIEEYASDGEDAGLCCGAVEIVLRDGANCRYVNVQRWNAQSWHFTTKRVWLGRDARMDWLVVTLGSRLCKVWVESQIKEEGATAMMNSVMFGSGTQHFDHETLQDHQKGNSTSDLLFKTALKDHATSVYSGMIRIEPNAQKSDAYQANRNLLLSKTAKADSIPKLEIAANDVRCTHGATVGPVDPEQLFYLRARGVPLAEAQRLLVGGFFEQVFERFPMTEGLRRKLDTALERKLVG